MQAGIYRVRYPGAHRVRYEHIGDALALLPRAVAKPWCLARAAGMFFLAADAELAALRYRKDVYKRQAAPYGRSSPPRETDRIGRRTQSLPAMSVTAAQDVESASWMKALEQRISTYAFAETDLAAGSLAALLWACLLYTSSPRKRR